MMLSTEATALNTFSMFCAALTAQVTRCGLSRPRHSEWLANSRLVINDVFLRQHVRTFWSAGMATACATS